MITKLNLDGSDQRPDLPVGDVDSQGASPSLYSSIAGQILVGRYILHIGQPFGAVLEETTPTQHPFRARATPILQRPGLTRGFLDRRQELTDALSAVDAGLSIEISGEPGVGKTAFLHQLAHHSGAAAFVDGVAYIAARHQSSADILQLIFEAFFETDHVRKPTITEIRRGLEDKQALILLDDVQLVRDELEQVLDVAPRSALALATRERCLFGEVRSLVLKGLPVRAGATLLEREVGRALSTSEQSLLAGLSAALDGHPLRIRQAAAVVRDRGIALDVVARDIVPARLITELVASTDEKQRRALLAMAAMPAVALPSQHVAGLAEATDIESSLVVLVHRGLVVCAQSRYRLVVGVADQLRKTEDLKPWSNRAITYFTAWAERNRRSANTLMDDDEALQRVQQYAVDVQRWGEVLRLGRLLEAALVLGARWGAWAGVLDRCLVAAKAMKDRQAEAWALHETGTRALCLGESGKARALLSQAVKLRETMEDKDATAASRRNLSFVLAPVSVPVPVVPAQRSTARFADVTDLESLPYRDAVVPAAVVPNTATVSAVVLLAMLFVVLGGLAYWARFSGVSWASRDVADGGAILQSGLGRVAPPAEIPPPPEIAPQPARMAHEPRVLRFSAFPDVVARGESLGLCYEVVNGARVRIDPDVGEVGALPRNCVHASPVETTTYVLTAEGEDGAGVRQTVLVRVGLDDSTPRPSVSDRASILIFTPRPGSIATGGPMALCYAVNGAVHARIDPGVGEVSPANTLTCLRVVPTRTTTYELNAYGRDGYHVRRQLVIVAR